MNHSNSSKFFTLSEIAGWFGDDHSAEGKPVVEIPAFQRGLVWNAAQIEVLWDSLMRDIPIGAFSLLPMRGNERFSKTCASGGETAPDRYFLLDGQQRANAIALGFQPFPADAGKSDDASILWIDLKPADALAARSSRKHFFYVTTPARPWGYRIDDANGENRSGKVPVALYREALNESGWQQSSAKPAPAELWPVCANYPVPVSVLRNLDASALSCGGLISSGGEAPWALHLKRTVEMPNASVPELDAAIRTIHARLAETSATRVLAMVAPDGLAEAEPDNDGDNSEIALYFTRLNRGGTTPSREDLDYSILKSILPELHQIDGCAKDRMHPARLAHLAMLAFLSRESRDGWKRGLSRRDIFGLKGKPDFSRYIAENLSADIDAVDAWLLGDAQSGDFGLPPYLRTQLTRGQPNLFRFLLLLAARMRERGLAATAGFSLTFRAFPTMLAWFGNDGAMDFASLAKQIDAVADGIADAGALRRTLGEWLAAQIESGALSVPPTPAYFNNLSNAVEKGDMDAVRSAWNDPAQSGANNIWYWNSEAGRGIVLYACRKYLAATFAGYDPAKAVWNEDARPWDYDHIVPQSWLKGTYHGKWHELVAKVLNSIGNIAPIPFGANRSKGDIPPGSVSLYREAEPAKALYVDFGIDGRVPEFVDHYVLPESDKGSAFDFARVTIRRMAALHAEWWNTLDVGALLSECHRESRKAEVEAFAAALKERFPEEARLVRIVFNAADGTQRDVENAWDWARPWISCGIPGWWRPKGSDKRIRCFLARTFQNGHIEMGLRRHPDETTIDGKNEWWVEGQYRTEGDFLAYAASVLSVCDAPHPDGVFEPDEIGPDTDCDLDWDDDLDWNAINPEENGQGE